MPFVIRPPGEAAPPLTDRLAGLGRARRLAAVAAGALTLFAAGLAAVGAVCVLDAAVHLPAPVRVLLLAGILTAAGVLYLRGVRKPARQSTHPLSVALLLEDLYPPLNDSVASAVEFLSADAATADRLGSARFRRVAVIRAGNLLDRYDLDEVVPSGKAWKAFWFAALAAAGLFALAFADRPRAAVALARLLDPYGRHPFPTRTTIDLREPTTFPVRHPKGEPFDLKFALRGVIPDRAVVQVRLAGGAAAEDVIPFAPADPPAAEVAGELKLDAGRVPRDFELRVVANDADTGWMSVTVAPPPVLVPLDGRPSPRVRLDFPAYTDLPAVDLPDGTGIAEAVAGTRVSLRAAADRPIASAVVRPMFDVVPARVAAVTAALAGRGALAAAAAHLLTLEATADVPVQVSGVDRDRLDVRFTPRLSGLYALRFTDDTGLTGVRLLDLRVFPDPAPVVALQRPEPDRGTITLLPTASVPLVARAEDRTFAVRDVVLEYRVGDADVPFRPLPLLDFAAAARAAPAVVGGFPGPLRAKPLGADIVARSIPLAAFVKPDGSPPTDGDLVTLRVASSDWDDLSWTKGPGRSKEVEIRVASRSGLEAMLQTELAKLRPELLRAREDQRAVREAVAEIEKAAAAGKTSPDDAAKLAKAEQAQRELRNKVADPADGLRAKADRLREALKANPLPRSPTAERVEAVADDLGRLADDHLEAADPLLDAARREADKGSMPKLAEAAGKATREQKSAEAVLDAALEKLDQWGGAGEVRGGARAIKEQLNKAGADAAKAGAKVPAGKDPTELTPREKQDLEGPAGKLDDLSQQADGLLNKAGRLAAEKDRQAGALAATAADKEQQAAAAAEAAGQTPGSEEAAGLKAAAEALKAEAAGLRKAAEAAKAEAEALRQSVAAAGGDDLPSDLRAAADALRDNQPGNAAAKRQAAADRLDQLTDALTEQKSADGADELRKKRKAAAADADRLAEAQDELQKKAKAAAEIADPKQREEAFHKLAEEQEKLRRRAEELAQRLAREKEDRPADAARRAAEKMAAARDELGDGKAPTEKQDEALDKLDETLDKLESEQKQDQDQLTREKREELADQLKAVRDRQAAAVAEAGRIQDAVTRAKEWGRGHMRSYAELEPGQTGLAAEVRALTEKHLAELPVFARLAGQAAGAMDRAARKTAERVQDTTPGEPLDAEAEALADDRVRGPMRTALRRLDQILDAVKPDPKLTGGMKPDAAAGGEAGGGGGGEGGTGAGVPPLAQLKALRAVQAEVNERTAAFAKTHPDPAKFSDDDKDELKELEQTQREVAELFDALAAAFQSGVELP